ALVLMNDTQYVEVARRLAERIMTEAPSSPEERSAFGFRLATARRADPDEVAVLARTYSEQLAEYQSDPEAAAKLVAVGDSKRNESLDVAELAAWTMVANLILNLDETVTKR
ncbi:MAG: DUF1553 domain-containing protein, partial [Pirellulales bacterium]